MYIIILKNGTTTTLLITETNDIFLKCKYTIGIVNVIKSWLFEIHGNKISADDIFEGYKFMISHTFFDLFKK